MNTGLVDHRGLPIASDQYRKESAPPQGEKFGVWAGNNVNMMNLPGGGLVQFNLDALQLSDYRSMLTHYQVNSSLMVLQFMLHQSNWTIECDDKKTRDLCTEVLTNIWTQLNASMSQAHWAGYAPSVLQWENDSNLNATVITKVKDLVPESCEVNWKFVEGYSDPTSNAVPPKIPVYDGIRQLGWPKPIPQPVTFWYPILMQNGNYYGRKLLKSAYQSYFFSTLIHLFANRYYDRFGEPTPVGRAPFDDTVKFGNGQEVNSAEFMMNQLQQLRNRSIIVLPNGRGEDQGTSGSAKGYWDYDVEYLESQMRGADFERYMQRLDQEISLSIFTPVLLLQTADVGSYNLGVGHMQMYLWMLNALNGDRKVYIDKYILDPLVNFNAPAGIRAPRARIKFNKLDNTNSALLQAILTGLMGKDKVKFDYTQLSEMAGMTLSEVKAAASVDPTQDPLATDPKGNPAPRENPAAPVPGGHAAARDVRNGILARVTGQVENAFRDSRFDSSFKLGIGYRRKFEDLLSASGVNDPGATADSVYSRLDLWAADMAAVGGESAREIIDGFTDFLDQQIDRALAS